MDFFSQLKRVIIDNNSINRMENQLVVSAVAINRNKRSASRTQASDPEREIV